MLPVRVTSPFQDCGLFAAKRRFDLHAGVDFYCEEGAEVTNVFSGVVTDVFIFTGEEVGSPWWNTTQAVVVDCGAVTYVYGEVVASVNVGDCVEKGDILGAVTPVLKKDKGKTPQCMLHLEMWLSENYIKNFTWEIGQERPCGLLDPLMPEEATYCGKWLIKTETGYILQGNGGYYLRYFAMAADSKAFLQDTPYKYLTEASPIEDKLMYTICTGKTLWFDNKG
jgi:hypothetical protein